MTSLIKRLLGMSEEESTDVSFDNGIEFLRCNGVDISKVDFPCSIDRISKYPTERYSCYFSGLNAKMVVDSPSDKAVTVVSGHYHSQAVCGGQDDNGNWYPAEPADYTFSIRDNNLKLKKKEFRLIWKN